MQDPHGAHSEQGWVGYNHHWDLELIRLVRVMRLMYQWRCKHKAVIRSVQTGLWRICKSLATAPTAEY